MKENKAFHIDEATIQKAGLQLSNEGSKEEEASPDARKFIYPGLEGVYIMEKDLYGNAMPEGSCFLAFQGKHGLMGQPLPIETLRNTDAAGLQKIIESNSNG
jgi:hypothetical protein